MLPMTPEESVEEPLQEDIQQTLQKPPRPENIQWMFDNTLLMYEIKARLMGGWLAKNRDGEYIIKRPKGAVAFMNTAGIENTMAALNATVTPIHSTSVFDGNRIFELCRLLRIELASIYFNNLEKFDIAPEKASFVISIVMNAVEANWNKSIGGRALLSVLSNERVTEIRNSPQPQKKFLGIF